MIKKLLTKNQNFYVQFVKSQLYFAVLIANKFFTVLLSTKKSTGRSNLFSLLFKGKCINMNAEALNIKTNLPSTKA